MKHNVLCTSQANNLGLSPGCFISGEAGMQVFIFLFPSILNFYLCYQRKKASPPMVGQLTVLVTGIPLITQVTKTNKQIKLEGDRKNMWRSNGQNVFTPKSHRSKWIIKSKKDKVKQRHHNLTAKNL